MQKTTWLLGLMALGLSAGEALSVLVVADDFSSYATGVSLEGVDWNPKVDTGDPSQQDLLTGYSGGYAVLSGQAKSNYHAPNQTGFTVGAGQYAVVASGFRYVYVGGGDIIDNFNKNIFGLLVSTSADWDAGTDNGFYIAQRGGAIGSRLPNDPWIEGWITHSSLGVSTANADTSNWFNVEWTIRDISGSLHGRATLTDGASVNYTSTEIDLGIATGTELFAGYSTGGNNTGLSVEGFGKISEVHMDNFEVNVSASDPGGIYPFTDSGNLDGWIPYEPMSDEFDGSTVNSEKWEKLSWDGRKPVYHDFNNVSLSNGMAVLKTSWTDGPVSSVNDAEYSISAGYFQSTTERRYGYFEIKCRALDFPMVTGWWLTGGGRAYTREIDMLECPSGVEGRKNEYSCNFHIWKTPTPEGVDDNGGNSIADPEHYTLPWNMVDDFHVYGFEWDKEFCRIYIDGVLYRTKATESFKVGQRLMVGNEYNQWFAPLEELNTNLYKVGATYDIDYVRAWIKPETDATWYVDAGYGNDANDGTSWNQAKKTIQGAVDEAYDGDSIWVAQGTYQEYVTFHGMNNLKVYGGFIAGDLTLEDQDPKENSTVIQAPPDGYSPVCIKGNHGFRLDGFTVKGATGAWHDHGVDIEGPCTNVVIANCRMIQNQPSAGGGGGTYVDGVDGADSGHALTQVRYENCEISENESTSDGAAFYVRDGAHVELTDSKIMNNRSAGKGGVLNLYSWNNTGNPNTYIRMSNCLITGNSNTLGSAAMRWNFGTVDFIDCTIAGNHSDAIELYSGGGASCSLSNSVLVDNHGEGFYSSTADFILEGNLFNANPNGHVNYGGDKNSESAINGLAQASGNRVADPNLILIAGSDSDMDLMPDWWELENGLDVTRDDSGSDYDNDTSSAGVEFIAGTDPENSASVFAVEGESGASVYKVYIPSAQNRIYSVEFADDLLGNWDVLTNGISGTGSLIELVDPVGSSNRFYRVKVKL